MKPGLWSTTCPATGASRRDADPRLAGHRGRGHGCLSARGPDLARRSSASICSGPPLPALHRGRSLVGRLGTRLGPGSLARADRPGGVVAARDGGGCAHHRPGRRGARAPPGAPELAVRQPRRCPMQLGVEVENLLWRRRVLGEVHAVNVTDVLPKPVVERLVGACQCSHRRLDVGRFDDDDRDVAAGRALDPHSLSRDAWLPGLARPRLAAKRLRRTISGTVRKGTSLHWQRRALPPHLHAGPASARFHPAIT